MSEARGSHCMPLERAKSATRRRIVLGRRARAAEVGRRPVPRHRPCSSRKGSRSAGRRSPGPRARPDGPGRQPRRRSWPRRPPGRRAAAPGGRAPAGAAATSRRPMPQPRSRRAARAWHQRCRCRRLRRARRGRQTTGAASVSGRPGRSSAVTSNTSSASRSASNAAQPATPVPSSSTASLGPSSRQRRMRCDAAGGVVARRRRARSRARSAAGRGQAPPAGSGRLPRGSAPARRAAARRRAARALAQAQPEQGRDVAEERGLLRHRLEQHGGREDPGSCTSRWATTLAETGSPVSADSSPKHCGGTSSSRRPPSPSSTRTAPSISPNSSADGTPARRMMSPASKRRVSRCRSRRASAVGRNAGEQRVQGERQASEVLLPQRVAEAALRIDARLELAQLRHLGIGALELLARGVQLVGQVVASLVLQRRRRPARGSRRPRRAAPAGRGPAGRTARTRTPPRAPRAGAPACRPGCAGSRR